MAENKPLSDLQDERFTFVTTDHQIEAAVESIGYLKVAQHLRPGKVTGMVVEVRDGDYAEVWMTDWRRPYDLSTQYTQII